MRAKVINFYNIYGWKMYMNFNGHACQVTHMVANDMYNVQLIALFSGPGTQLKSHCILTYETTSVCDNASHTYEDA